MTPRSALYAVAGAVVIVSIAWGVRFRDYHSRVEQQLRWGMTLHEATEVAQRSGLKIELANPGTGNLYSIEDATAFGFVGVDVILTFENGKLTSAYGERWMLYDEESYHITLRE